MPLISTLAARRTARAIGVTAVLLLAMQYLEYRGVLAGPESTLLDRLQRVARTPAALPPVITVEIDDAAYRACFDSMSPLDARAIFQVVHALDAAEPSVIGVDVPTGDPRQAGEYRSLAAQFPEIASRAVWISRANDRKYDVAPFPRWLVGDDDRLVVKTTPVLGFDAEELDEHRIRWGVPVFPRDAGRGFWRLPRDLEMTVPVTFLSPRGREEALSWARIVARRYCLTGNDCRIPGGAVPQVYLAYAGEQPKRVSMLDILSCPERGRLAIGGRLWTEFQSMAKGRIVLLGETWGTGAGFPTTPIGRIPGLLVNAFAVLAEINGMGIRALRREAIVYGIMAGLGVACIGWILRDRRFSALISATAVFLLLALILDIRIFERGYVLSFAGLITGLFLYQIFEGLKQKKGR
jgi:hypothetical protein